MVGSYLIGALGLALLMVIHEGGHYFAARAYGMRVTKFSIGFGPTLFKIQPEDGYYWFATAADRIKLRLWKHDPKKHGPTIFQVAMIPFLAYVQIAGMNPLEDIDPEDKGSYANASLLGRVVTIVGGPFANYAFASVFFFLSLFTGGKISESTDVNVLEGRPAATEARLQDGDKIIAIDGTPVSDWNKMAEIIAAHPGQKLAMVVMRGEERVETTVTPAKEDGAGKIGVMRARVSVSAKDAAILAITMPPQVVRDSVIGIGKFITGEAEGRLAGPVGMVKETAQWAKGGSTDLLTFLGILSAYLGAFNLIPFPALDGGRLMFLSYEAMTRRRPNARIEAHVHAIGLFMILGLVLYVTIANDILGGPK